MFVYKPEPHADSKVDWDEAILFYYIVTQAMPASVGRFYAPVCKTCKFNRTLNKKGTCTKCLDILKPHDVPLHRLVKKRILKAVNAALLKQSLQENN